MRSVLGVPLGAILSALLCAALGAILFSAVNCSSYNPALYPSYDVLNPASEVRLNPLGFVLVDAASGAVSVEWDKALPPAVDKNGLLVVNFSFWLWTKELSKEVLALRKELLKAGRREP